MPPDGAPLPAHLSHPISSNLRSDFKDLIKQKFDARVNYDKDNERHPTLAAQLVSRANLQPGWTVLDLACGTGLVTYLAAADVGPDGFATGVDLSAGLLQQVTRCVQ